MKSVPFDYHVPTSVPAAIKLLTSLPNARLLAGGQSLLPMLNLRIAAFDHLIDLSQVPGLTGIRETKTGLEIGATTTQREVERSALVRAQCPLLTEAVGHVGHQQTRNRGTIGGSICHFDPGAELPVAAAVLDAIITIEGPQGTRTIDFKDFATGYLTTVVEPDEIMTQIAFSRAPPQEGFAFLEFNQRPADFAIVSVAVTLAMDRNKIAKLRIAVGGVHYAPIRLQDIETTLQDASFNDEAIEAAVQAASELPCYGDDVNPANFRQHVAGVLVRRAMRRAALHARGKHD
jgi:carbon-monoxide dehydrogenase medium subunit